MTFDHIPDGRWGLAERVRPVDSRPDLSRFDEIPEDHQVFGVLRRHEHAQLLAHEWGQQLRPDVAVESAEPPSIGLASDDDEPPARGEGSTEL